MYRLLAMYAVFMAIHMTHGRFNGYSDGHVACCKPQSSLIDGVIGPEVAWGLGRVSAFWKSWRLVYSPYKALSKRMCPELDVQHAGGGARACACNRKAWLLCMKRTMVFGLMRAAKKVRHSSLIPCDRYAQGCIKQSPGRLHGSLDVDDGKDVCALTWGFGAGVAADAAVGNAPAESDACRGLCDGAMAPDVGYRGISHPCTCRYSKALALGSRARRFGL